jgi:hypothetical protein
MQYDFDGNPIAYEEWYALFAEDRRGVACTQVGEVEVSTVWLGLDYSFGRGVPLIYETMVFGGPLDHRQERYPNRVAALAGHDRWVAAVRRRAATEADTSGL